ncbi:flagellar biosynthesis protein FlhF [Polynucleobacter sp. HIN8]|uniref:flagellar biosynthesis protein FlhF n=1 Tax=Polynucleobacter sp. HIN8 TaxID=3047867 RepID=UPI002573140F|nr:flagellar biosynthesis protein FlhF [Polynucleobacter sp. HIN8]BEI39600.1 flagellar biosynthesis protein FlhF [Polynucleobacter sp. HIN8]
MGPQKFTASNTAEALKKVRLEMGADAMILSTSDTVNGVEIVAITPQDLAKLSSGGSGSGGRPRDLDPEVEIAPSFAQPAKLSAARNIPKPSTFATADPSNNAGFKRVEFPRISPSSANISSGDSFKPAFFESSQRIPASEAKFVGEGSEETPVTPKSFNGSHRNGAAEASPNPKTIAELANSPRVEKLLSEIGEVKNLLQSRVAGNFWGNLQQEKAHLTEVIKHLLNTGFSPQLCADITRQLPETSDLPTLLQNVRDQIKGMIKTVDAFATFDKGGVFAFIGPTGVGKTTTVAKIAARCVLRYGRNQVTLLTTDTYRIGAQEQLKVFAKILGLTVTSLRDGEDLSTKLKELSGRKIVLLDTAGVSQRDTLMLEQSKTLQDGSQNASRILVMSSTTDLRTQEEVIKLHNQAAQKNGAGKIDAAVITKIDEAAHVAPVVDSIIRHDMPLLFISNGQRVPEDLSLPDLDYLSHRAVQARAFSEDLSYSDDQIPAIFSNNLGDWIKTS